MSSHPGSTHPVSTRPGSSAAAARPPAPLPHYSISRPTWQVARRRLVTAHADLLPPEDAALLRAAVLQRTSHAALARLTGRSVHAVRRRCTRLLERLAMPRFALVAALLPALPAHLRPSARALFLHGRSLTQASADLDLPIATLRRHRRAILALLPRRTGPSVASVPTHGSPAADAA